MRGIGIGIGLPFVRAVAGAGFTPGALPNLLLDWRFDEGSGDRVANRANATRAAKNLVWLPDRYFNKWNAFNTTTVTDNAGADPDGNATAARLQIAATGTKSRDLTIRSQAQGTYTLSLYAKSNSGSDEVLRLGVTDNGSASLGSDIPITAAGGWQRITRTFTSAGAVTAVRIVNGSAAPATDVLICRCQFEAGGSATAYEEPQFDLRLNGGSSPTWVTGGIRCASGQNAYAVQTAPRTLSTFALYFAVKTGAWSQYQPILTTEGTTRRFYFAGTNESATANALTSCRFSSGSQINARMHLGRDGLWHTGCYLYDGTNLNLYIDDILVETLATTVSAQAIVPLVVNDLTVSGSFDVGYMALYTVGTHDAATRKTVTDYIRATVSARGVSVAPGGAARLLVNEGDSISASATGWTSQSVYTAAAALGTTYPFVVSRALAVSGNSVTNAAARTATRDAIPLPTTTRKVLTVAFGANDLNGAGSATTFLTNLKSYCQGARAAGWYVIVGTVLARAASIGGAASIDETVRATANAEITNGANIGVFWDAVADVASDAIMGPFSWTANATYTLDGTHPTVAGHALLAPYWAAALQTALAV